MAVLGFVKFQVCLKSVNISFELEFGNPRFETKKKLNVFNFQLTCFSAIVDLIIELYNNKARHEIRIVNTARWP